eukprot:1194343-Prorocentrum_minimum.AAC.5
MQSLSEVTPCYENFYGAESVLGSWKVVHTRVHHESKAQYAACLTLRGLLPGTPRRGIASQERRLRSAGNPAGRRSETGQRQDIDFQILTLYVGWLVGWLSVQKSVVFPKPAFGKHYPSNLGCRIGTVPTLSCKALSS